MDTARQQGPHPTDVSPASPAMDDLYRKHRDWLRDLARRRLRLEPADAEDVVQEAYLRLAQKGPAKVRQPRAFLAQVAINLLRDGRRRTAVRSAHARSAQPFVGSEAGSGALKEQEVRFALEQVILALPEPQRDVFVLSRFQNMSNRDIADHLGVSIKTVEWRMSRALDFCLSKLRD